MLPRDDPTTLSLLFHLNSEPWLNEEAYKGAAHPRPAEGPAVVGDAVPLPRVAPSPLVDLLLARRSSRSFLHTTLTLAEVAAVLQAAYGVVEVDRSGDGLLRRSVPSAGGLFPLDVYVFLHRVEGVGPGLYRYDAETASLDLLREGDQFEALRPELYPYPMVENANVILALVATFTRTQAKYGPRGYRYILLEAGHVGQNVCLRAVELGLGSLCMGGYADARLNRMLGLDPRQAGVVYTVAIGRPAPG